MKKLIGLIAALAFVNAQAADKVEKMDWRACENEIKEFKCAGNDKAIWACLEKYDDKHSPACAKVHEQGDAKFKK